MNSPPETLSEVLDDVWSRVLRAVHDRKSPWRTGCFSTIGPGGPCSRTVVLRDADRSALTLTLHTDARAEKVSQVQQDPRVAWLFYNAKDKVQARLRGTATLHRNDDVAKARWDKTSDFGRRVYLIPNAPGTESDGPTSGLPAELEDRAPTPEESAPGIENFVVVTTKIETIEWLWLSAHGHRRARWKYEGDGVAHGSWLVP